MSDKNRHPSGLSATYFEKPDAPLKPARFDYKTGRLLKPGTNTSYEASSSERRTSERRKSKKKKKNKERSPGVLQSPVAGSPNQLSPHATTQYGTPTAVPTVHQPPPPVEIQEQPTNFDAEEEAGQMMSPHVQTVRRSDRQISAAATQDKAVQQQPEERSIKRKKRQPD